MAAWRRSAGGRGAAVRRLERASRGALLLVGVLLVVGLVTPWLSATAVRQLILGALLLGVLWLALR
jgi:hypothetical protein